MGERYRGSSLLAATRSPQAAAIPGAHPLPRRLQPARLHRSAALCCIAGALAAALAASGQNAESRVITGSTTTAASSTLGAARIPTPVGDSQVARVPGLSAFLRGVNAGVTVSGLHDAQSGWATILQPAVAYDFNRTFSLDATIPVYMSRLAQDRATNLAPGSPTTPQPAQLVPQYLEPGDLLFGLHALFFPGAFRYQATLSATAPTGDVTFGLSSGRPTFDLSNRFERPFNTVTPILELGIGDSTTLVNQLVQRNFTSLGPLAHFQFGVAVAMPFNSTFETGAYEQLPIGDQKIYQTAPRPDGPPVTFVTGRSVSEDNGFTNSLLVPLNRHATLTAYYNRSLRLHDDVVSIGITWVLRGSNRHRQTSDDRLLNSINREIQERPASPQP